MRFTAVLFLAFLLSVPAFAEQHEIVHEKTLSSLITASEKGDSLALDGLLKKAKNNDVDAELALGEVYYHGIEPKNAPFQLLELNYFHINPGTMKDYDEAMQWFRKAADQGNAVAQERIGAMYGRGKGITHSNEEALKWYLKAAEQGNADAEYRVGEMYRGGNISNDFNLNQQEAAKWIAKAAVQGNAAAQTAIGEMYTRGLGLKKDYTEAMKWLQKAVDQGSTDAQVHIGHMYESGQGVAVDKVQAYMWFCLASAGGGYNTSKVYRDGIAKEMMPAQIAEGKRLAVSWQSNHLAVKRSTVSETSYYYGGDDISTLSPEMEALRTAAMKGDVKTFSGLKSLAEKGNVEAQLELGGLYWDSLTNYPIVWEVTPDNAEAKNWFGKAADQGNAQAQYLMGELNAGHGMSEAVKWYSKAADQSYPPAIAMLGAKYMNGTGVARNWAEGMKLYFEAANRGVAWVQVEISKGYEDHQLYEEAYFWQLVAVTKSDDGNHSLPIDFVEKNLTPDQIASAKKRMKEWSPLPFPAPTMVKH